MIGSPNKNNDKWEVATENLLIVRLLFDKEVRTHNHYFKIVEWALTATCTDTFKMLMILTGVVRQADCCKLSDKIIINNEEEKRVDIVMIVIRMQITTNSRRDKALRYGNMVETILFYFLLFIIKYKKWWKR